MKTFKLKGLTIMKNEADSEKVKKRSFSLVDGLVINREDEHGWLIEAFLLQEDMAYFESIADEEDLMIQIKITREDNDPAFFITKIVEITEIGQKMNVIFQGNIVDHSKSRIEELLQQIIEEGYQGESLLQKFKESI
ncbi:MAG TPA: YwpF family protein [Pseudogracilibacillus sp.]|nr:YwpF family protein [Pseudogracilibacillus sp.]